MNSMVRAELLAQCHTSEGEYVFPSDSKTGHLEDVKTAFNNACTDARIEDFHFHYLRRTGLDSPTVLFKEKAGAGPLKIKAYA